VCDGGGYYPLAHVGSLPVLITNSLVHHWFYL
jgi:hypothetical protein